MIPLADLHCHLLAGLDDGPRTEGEALAMCRQAYADGTHLATALAHQNEAWPGVTPAAIRAACRRLAELLHTEGVPLAVFPTAEVMAHPGLERRWAAGELVSVADRGQYLLVEMPHGLAVDLAPLCRALQAQGVRPILAHAERQPELLHDPARVAGLIAAGCLIQVNAGSVTAPPSRQDEKALKAWFRRGVAHLVGSDGHSPRGRPPLMRAAYERIARWAGASAADRVCSTNGTAILHGLALRVAPPQPERRGLFRSWLGI